MAGVDLTRVGRLAAWPNHRRVLTQAIEHFHKDARVPGLLLGGSFAGGCPDFYSDLDLYVIVQDEHFVEALAAKEAAAAAAGPVLAGFIPDHLGPGGDEMYIAVYDGPVKVDFNYVRLSAFKPNWKLVTRVVLKDSDGLLREVIGASAGLTPPAPSREPLEALHNKFWTWCWYVFGKVMRGELWEALDGLHSIRSLALVPLLESDASRFPEGFRRLESRVSDSFRARLATTVCGLDAAALYAALRVEIELFRELQGRVYRQYGVTVDETGGRAIQDAIDRAWTSRGQ
jgi:Streptomycin adenylyltransferase